MWTRRDQYDLKNGIILTFFAIIVVLYSKVAHHNLDVTSYFSPEQKAYDNENHDLRTLPSNPVGASQILGTETTHFDGLVKYTRTIANAQPTLLVMVLTRDATSWGHDVKSPPRTFHDFLDLLISTKIDMRTTSLALWTSSRDQYNLMRTATLRLPLARVSIFFDPHTDTSDRSLRHDPDYDVQTKRRARVARLRNKLLLHALGAEPHHLWLDADIQRLSRGIVQRMLNHSTTLPDAGIITARCKERGTANYDKNAWAGSRPGPTGSESPNPGIAVLEVGPRARLVDELIRGTSDSDLVPLDAVGGTILYMRAKLVWEGLNFPSYYVVGTRWGRDGGDGIETEGLCYAARHLEGGGCWVLGGRNYVVHTNE